MLSMYYKLQKKIYELKRVLYDQNTFLSVQFLFAWVFFKILGFLRLPFDIRVFALLVSLLIFFLYWRILLTYFLNNVIFQIFLYLYYHLLNFLVKYNNGLFYFSLFFSFCLLKYCSEIHSFYLNEQKLFFPNMLKVFIFLFSYEFIRKFTNHIIFKFVENGFFCPYRQLKPLSWQVLIIIINHFFYLSVNIRNRMGFLNLDSLGLVNYPVPHKMLLEFCESETDIHIFLNDNSLDQKISKADKQKKHLECALKRKCLGERLAKELQHLSDLYFFQIIYGLYCGFFLCFLALNLIMLSE